MSTADTNVEQGDAARGWFQTTHWSVVLGTGLEDTARADAALSNLCRAYWYPVYSYLRRVGNGPAGADFGQTGKRVLRLEQRGPVRATQTAAERRTDRIVLCRTRAAIRNLRGQCKSDCPPPAAAVPGALAGGGGEHRRKSRPGR